LLVLGFMDTPPGKVIRSLRQALAMSQAEFGRAAGWSASTISSWERGSTKPSRIAFKTILAFAEERGVRYRPKSEGAAATLPATGGGGLPVLRLGSRSLAPPALVTRESGRQESFGSRRWTDVAAHRPDVQTSSFEARAAALAERPEWHVDARLQVRLGAGTRGLRRTSYVVASLAALAIGLGAGVLFRSGIGSSAAPRVEARRAIEPPSEPAGEPASVSPPAVATRPVPPVQVDELALAAPAMGQALHATAPADATAPAAAPESAPRPAVHAPSAASVARLESIVSLDGVRRATFRVGDRSLALVEGDQIGGRSIARIADEDVTLVGGGTPHRVRLGFDAPLE
jgi:transcriptional regulator with XRE-family HTH domain